MYSKRNTIFKNHKSADMRFSRMTQKKYNENPHVSGWFFVMEKTVTLRNQKVVPSLNSFYGNRMAFIHLKDGLLHKENGPALVTGCFLEFHLNGSPIENFMELELTHRPKFSVVDSEWKYEQDQECIEHYSSTLRMTTGPANSKWSQSGIFKDGKFKRPKESEHVYDRYGVDGRYLSLEEFHNHPAVIRLDIKNKLKAL